MKKHQSTTAFLGVVATSRAVHAALVERGPEGPVVVGTFLRQRVAGGAPGAGLPGAAAFGATAGGLGTPNLEENAAPDFTIQFGGQNGGQQPSPNLFLGTEFSGADAKGEEEGGEDKASAEAFAVELSEILDECTAAGFPSPTLVFAGSAAHLNALELTVPPAKKGRKEDRAAKPRAADRAADRDADAPAPKAEAERAEKMPSHEALVKLLKEQVAEAEADRSAFLPMTPGPSGLQRVLALVARPNDPVPATLDVLRKQPGTPPIGFLDAEAALYVGLATAQSDGGDVLVVRASTEDTVVLFLRGGRVHHAETLRSLTAFDAPETICSRVLLQQDECGVDEVGDVLVLSEQREEDLVRSFDTFFAGARVRALRTVAAAHTGSASFDGVPALALPAALAALRGVDEAPLSAVNLLPRRYLRRKIEFPFSVPVLALGVLLVSTALFFSYRYVSNEHAIDEARNSLRQFPPTLAEEDARTLQARIDSLEGTYQAYKRALGVVDSLLVGSDRWSRTLEKTSREAAAVRGIWIDTWTPNRDLLTLDGTATTRDRVVALAERTGGDIEKLTFHEIRDWPVYTFTLRMPLPNALPEAAEYLRAQALARLAEAKDAEAAAPAAPGAGEARPAAETAPDEARRTPVRTAALARD